MAQLTGNAIQSSYLGLLKTNNNAALPAAGLSNPIQDGAGNDSMINMSQTELQLGTNHNTQYFKQFAASGGSTELKDISIRLEDAAASQYLQIDANNAGIGAGSNYMVSTPTGSSIVGPLDLSNATVTGLPSSGGGTNFVGSNWTLSSQASQDIVYETVTIPGGTYGVGDVISLQEIEYRDGLNNWGYSSWWISDTAQTVGQSPAGGANNFSLAQLQSPDTRYSNIYNKTLFITSAGTYVMPVQQQSQAPQGGGDPTEIFAINWANDQHFFFQLWNDSTTGSYSVSGISITQRS